MVVVAAAAATAEGVVVVVVAAAAVVVVVVRCCYQFRVLKVCLSNPNPRRLSIVYTPLNYLALA